MSQFVEPVGHEPEQGREREDAEESAGPEVYETSCCADEDGVGKFRNFDDSELLRKLHNYGDSDLVLGRKINSILTPVVSEFGARVEEVLKSQSTLETSISRLTQELDMLLEDSPKPLGAQHTAKLSGIRKCVGSLTETLRTIQGRISNIDRTLSKENDPSSWLSLLPLRLHTEEMSLRGVARASPEDAEAVVPNLDE